MEPHVCTEPSHGALAHKHAGSLRWFYKPAPQPERGGPLPLPGVTRG